MQTKWISNAAQEFRQHLVERRREEDSRRALEEKERDRKNRLAAERVPAGAKLWAELQSVIKYEVNEFNQAFGDPVMQTRVLGNGTFEVHLVIPGGAENIAALNYDTDKTTLDWHVFGGVRGTTLSVGLEPNKLNGQANTSDLMFSGDNSYYKIEEISQRVISSLLP